MNITATRFTTQLRSWLLIGGLTALVVAIGALLGGSWLYVFAFAAVAFNIVGYWFSDRIALKMSRAQPLEESQSPELYAEVRDLARRAQVPMPRMYLIASEQPNAFATGRNPQHSAVAVTQGLLRFLPRDQVRGVLAHEMAHIANRDILVSSIAAVLAGVVSGIANVLSFSFLFGGGDDDESPLGMIGALATIILAPIAATIIQLAVSRQREYLADASAAGYLGTPHPLADALGTLQRGTEQIPMAVNPATASLYIANPLAAFNGGLAGLFSTHPPMEERIRRLLALRPA